MVLYKTCESGAYTVHTPEGIQLQPKKRSGKDSWYVYYKRKQICLSDIPELETTTYPVYYNYVFGGGHQKGANWYYDMLLGIPAKQKPCPYPPGDYPLDHLF